MNITDELLCFRFSIDDEIINWPLEQASFYSERTIIERIVCEIIGHNLD